MKQRNKITTRGSRISVPKVVPKNQSFAVKVSGNTLDAKTVTPSESATITGKSVSGVSVRPARLKKKRPSFFGYIDDPVLGKQLADEFDQWQVRGRK